MEWRMKYKYWPSSIHYQLSNISVSTSTSKMHANIFYLVALPLAMTAVQASVTMNLYQDNNCQDPVPGDGWTFVSSGTCDTNVATGWSSAMITDNSGSPAGTLTFYSRNACAGTSHGYSSANYACLNNFGFVANAVGLAG
ncbi:hypothetical protein F5884DRAFT_467632 [Xylogone sp. PMI_703]|nr:hypothetical protein F5884DRAFT_467632 [Xylogone sp. PMI_703]